MVAMPPRPGAILGWGLRAPRALYSWRLDWLLGRRFLLLEHVGRNSGSQHRTVLEVIRYDRPTGKAFVMSGWGRTSDWYRNVEVAGHATITVGRRSFDVDARVVDDQDAANLLADYERRNGWMRPIIRRVLSRLSGLSYDGTDASRLQVARRLPVVEFSPRPSGDAL